MDSEKKHILHELYVFSEWKPEPDFIQKSDTLLPWNLNSVLKWIPFIGPNKSMLDDISFYKDHHERWHIALSDEGKVVAILTDNILEVRTKRSDYSTIAARTTVVRDGHAQWRKIVWSPDCSFLVLAHSNGLVSFYDLTANNIFNIAADCSRPGGMECMGTTHALSAIIFLPIRTRDNKWTSEVLLITHEGKLRGYLVSPIDGAKLHHTFHFSGGVSSAVFCGAHNLLITSGLPSVLAKDETSAMHFGISAWRILNDDPFYKLSVASDYLDAAVGGGGIHYYMSLLSSNKNSLVVKMEISPDTTKLVCLHTDGEVSVWRLPLLKLIHRWRLADQPEHNLVSPLLITANNMNKDVERFYAPVDINWWSSKEVILSRLSGAVTICNLEDMVNILGKEVVFLQGIPQLTAAHDNAFLALECESKVVSATQLRDSETSEQLSEIEEEASSSVLEASKELVKSVLFAITDIEHFQPKPKKITVVSRIYRLLGVKSTTPMDLFLRKIEAGNYDEALKLSECFNLDSDLVYQQQWRKTPVSCDAIYNYLAKVSKKIWVVHQCVDRLPETMVAAQDLLNFGLVLTNAEILEEVNRNKDDAIECHDAIELEDLNAHTSELLRCRHLMLFYAERLNLYESILKSEKSKYIRDEYQRLRSNSLVHSCVELAKEGRVAALSCLWLHISSINMQLTVLEHIPETIDPQHYSHLLPVQPVLSDQQLNYRVTAQNSDWCRKQIFRSIWNSNWSEEITPENEKGSLQLSIKDLSKWYDKRARDIEERSGLASHALTLLKLASSQGLPDLSIIMFNLVTLDVLLYEVNCEEMTLSKVEHMNSIEICCNLMIKSKLDTFVEDLQLYVLPFLKRNEEFSKNSESSVKGLCNFLESKSADDLSYVLAVLQMAPQLQLDFRTHLELAERCLLAHTTTTQLHIACDILTTVLKQSDGSIAPSDLVRRLNDLEKLINACNTLSCHDVHVTLSELKQLQKDSKKAQMVLTKLARNMSIRTGSPQQQDWKMLLSDIFELREIFFTCIEEPLCYEIYASALMTSGDINTVRLSSKVIECEASPTVGGGDQDARRVPYLRAVHLVLAAAEEYFNSASSLHDPALQLARTCLNLIEDYNSKIKTELDLVASLDILQSFGVSILPIQVRLRQDRMSLIEECLNIDPTCYLHSQKLITLAKLLRVAGDDDRLREGMVLQRIAECGLILGGADGGGAAAEAARRLAELRHGPAAALLSHVAASPHTDRHLRRTLIDAALRHAPTDILEDMLRARLSLELEDVERELGERLCDTQLTIDSSEDYADAVQTPVDEDKGLTPVVEENFMKISNLFVDQIWKNKISFGWLERSTREATKEEEKESYSICCPEFYASLYPEYAVSDLYYRYDRFATQAVVGNFEITIGLVFMKWFYISDCLQKKVVNVLESQVMQRCATQCTYSDTALSTACAVRALAGHVEPQQLTTAPPRGLRDLSAVCIALYGLLLQHNKWARGDQTFLMRPVQLARMMLGDTEVPQLRSVFSNDHITLIKICLNRLLATVECAKMRSFGVVVDTHLFHNDVDYRTQTIYRLARSLDRTQVEYACALATKYKVEEARVWSQHAGAIVLRHQAAYAPTADFQARLTDEHIMVKALQAHPHVIEEEIWDLIPGSDHAALISYFTLMKNVDEKWSYGGLSSAVHVKLLKKVKAASPDLDYKLLLKQPNLEEFTQHLLRILKPENVGLVTKLLRTIPANIKLPMSVNSVYTLWLTDLFFSIGSSAASKKWMQQYRKCASYFNKLTQHQLQTFIKNTCFTDKAIQRVPPNTRNFMIMQAVDYCQQERENDFKCSIKIEPSWSETAQELTLWGRFLENYHSSTVQAIIEKGHDSNNDVWMSLERSRGDSMEGRSSLVEVVLEGRVTPPGLATLLQCLHMDISLDQLFTHILDQDITEKQLQKVVSFMLYYDKTSCKLSSGTVERASTRAAQLHLQPNIHIALLSLTQKKQIQDEADLSSVALYSLQLLKSEWSDSVFIQNMSETYLQNEEGRKDIFLTCMRDANNWRKKKVLVDLICCWPDFTHTSSSHGLYYQYAEWLLSDIDNRSENSVLIKMLMRRPLFSEEEIKHLAENTREEAFENILWMILLTKSETLKSIIPNLTKTSVTLSGDLVKELLDSGLFTQLVRTPAYMNILNFIINGNESGTNSSGSDSVYSIKWAIKELTKANYLAEAGQLMLLHSGVPTSLKLFSESINCHKQN